MGSWLGQTTLRRRFDLILSTLNTTFDLNAYLGMLKPQGQLCVVAQPLQMLSISVGMLYDNALRSIYGNYVGSRRAAYLPAGKTGGT
jgi:D-arabinose 1-dehydrogenase-like Zn-dependent alcohol dehydrogenase